MIVFKDIFSGDELFSDTYKIEVVEDGLLYKVKGKVTSETTEVSDSMFGGNQSAEGPGDEGADGKIVQSDINIALSNKLEKTAVDKKSFREYIKPYCKRLVAKLQELGKVDEAKEFQKKASAYIPKVVKELDNYVFYTVSSYDVDAMLPMAEFEDDGVTAHMLFFKDGCIEEKF